jgi:hypothetical protein
MPTIATIGVYGFDRDSFLGALKGAEVELLLDVRQRRGVRGSEYAWANAQRLQASLAEAGIGYTHAKELAPTTAMREAQYREDDRLGEGKRSRTHLSPEYTRLYTEQIPRSRRPRADRQLDRLQPCRPALRRARPRGLPSLPDRGPLAGRVRLPGRAPTSPKKLIPI